MRLKKIKLGGFKSFVDPTTINLPSNMVGIVGPNGCGKSNVIDAVRWVMGESSAKTLRGESMADVIFNGSSSRKPVGTAYVELIFDNTDGTIGGQYAAYAEISIKRQVSRDGQSSYYLNNTKCRRKDITDIFLGTGLGPRSYAIIEQGMISRLIEARPEDLRVFLEEAAGISKYKERRRETETRIRHTKENLDRLNDLRDEITKQLQHLQRQARTAERFKELKAEERQTKAELFSLRWQGLQKSVEVQEQKITEMSTGVEQSLADQRGAESHLVKLRESHNEANDAFNQVQGRYYGVGSEIARLEQGIEHARELHRKQEQELAQLERDQREATEHSDADRNRLGQLSEQIEALDPTLDEKREIELAASEQLQAAEEALNRWHASWNDFNEEAAKPSQTAQVERTRIDHLEKQALELSQRRERIEVTLGNLATEEHAEAMTEAGEQILKLETALAEQTALLGAIKDELESNRSGQQQKVGELDDARSELQAMRGRAASLDALQQASLGKTKSGAVTGWLERNDLHANPRLAETLQVSAGWEKAVETVLGSHLEAVCVDGLDAVQAVLGELSEGPLELLEKHSVVASGGSAGRLSEQVQSDYPVSEALQAVYAVATLNDALALRGSFSAGESAITADGVWVGRHWLRLPKSGDDKSGVLGREQEIKALQQSIEEREADVERLNGELEELRNSQTSFEQRREMLQQAANDTNRQLVENRGNLQNMQRKVEDQRVRGEQLRTDKADIENRIAEANQSINSSRNQLETAINEMAKFERQRGELLAQRDQCRTTLEEIRITHRTARDEVHQIALQLETARTARKSVTENLSRTENQLQQLLQRREQVNEVLAQGDRPISELAQQLEEKLQLRMTVEQELAAARSGVEGLDEEIRNVEMQRNTLEQLTQERRAELDNCRLAWQALKVRRETVSEQLVETGHDPELVLREIDESATESTWQEKSDQLAQRIQRLGAINLAAIDEFAEQSQRKEYLDRQNADLVESLETLESAIQKIDRETRTRFKETFDKVNNSFQTAFPRLFGGGHAYLQFTDNDLLETGVAVMARPPGKRNTTIHLLSGGEKALTAVALVFAIFQLNPAPFCMLDEVDAPLDEANVGRFCTMVKEMSEKVQFVFITHNKTTMEMSRQLMGVTMHEPGVSRLVAVDVDEALELAATG